MYKKSIKLNDTKVEPKWNFAISNLLNGNFPEGWKGFEIRRQRDTWIKRAMNGKELKELIHNAKRIVSFLGGAKVISEEESVTSRFAFASVVADVKIKKGEKLSKNNLWVRRPGTGHFLAKDYNNLLGKKAKCDIEKGEQISPNHI